MALYKNLNDFVNDYSDKVFEREISNGEWGLFLGAGASLGAKNKHGNTPPMGDTLKDSIAHFLDYDDNKKAGLDLQMIYSIAHLKAPNEFRIYLRDLYANCQAGWQTTIGQFTWRNLFTTNIDDVLIDVYRNTNAFQKVTFLDYSDRVPMGISPSTLRIVYLHGLITRDRSNLILWNFLCGPSFQYKICQLMV